MDEPAWGRLAAAARGHAAFGANESLVPRRRQGPSKRLLSKSRKRMGIDIWYDADVEDVAIEKEQLRRREDSKGRKTKRSFPRERW